MVSETTAIATQPRSRPARFPRSLFRLALQSRLLAGKRRRWLVLAVGCVLIPLWQCSFAVQPSALDRRYRLLAASGIHHRHGVQGMSRFVYFLYYLGLFPVTTEREPLDYSREGAERILEEHGDSLMMEWGHVIRSGQLGSALLYLPDAWVNGSPKNPSVRPSHMVAFVLALEGLFFAFWWAGQPLLGAFAVLFLGANPFQLFEVYAHENVFGWPITAAVALLALHVPVLGWREPSRRATWALAVLAGLLVATFRQVRPEVVALLLSAGTVYLTVPRRRWPMRLALVALLAGAFVAGSWGWRRYFDHKFAQAQEAVRGAGGHPFPGPRRTYHLLWHPVWCGLGDFDETHGYVWNDVAAVAYARPILADRYGLELPPWDGRSLVYEHSFWDEAGHYYKTPYEMPHYEDVLRRKVLGDIARDPLWYLGILGRRAWRVLCETTPPRIAVGAWWASLPFHGLAALAVLAVALWARAWAVAKAVLFVAPLSFTALFIYSGGGTPYYSCYHLLAAAALGAWLVELLLWAGSAGRRAGAKADAPG
ncbi:MAG: hypothetical protein ACLF0G_06915 [Candidatus Brocadiia bacterium]